MPKTTTQPVPSHTTLPDIQRAFASTMRLKATAEAEREKRLSREYRAFENAKAAFEAIKKDLDIAIAQDAATERIGRYNEAIDLLKKQAQGFYDPAQGSTFREDDGAGFQFRATLKSIIRDEQMLAQSLIANKLWDAVGAELTVSPTKASTVLKTHPLPGLGIEPQITVAAYGPNQP